MTLFDFHFYFVVLLILLLQIFILLYDFVDFYLVTSSKFYFVFSEKKYLFLNFTSKIDLELTEQFIDEKKHTYLNNSH